MEYEFENVPRHLEPNTDLRVCFRPKHCRIVPSSEQLPADALRFEGEIASKSLTRDYVEYEVDCGEFSIMSRSSDTAVTGVLGDVGDRVSVVVDTDRLSIYDRHGDRVPIGRRSQDDEVDVTDSVT